MHTVCSEDVTTLGCFNLTYTGDNALWVPGIGAIAQHDCYIDMQWEKGVVYFMRDLCKQQIEARLSAPNPDMRAVRELTARMERLNSKIQTHEMALSLPDLPRTGAWADDDEWDVPTGYAEPRKRKRAHSAPKCTRDTLSIPTHNRFATLTTENTAPSHEPPWPASSNTAAQADSDEPPWPASSSPDESLRLGP